MVLSSRASTDLLTWWALCAVWRLATILFQLLKYALGIVITWVSAKKKDLENPKGKIVGTIQFRGVVLNAPAISKLLSKLLKLH